MPYDWQMHDWGSWWGTWHMLIPLIFWICVLAGLAFLVQRLSVGIRSDRPDSRALDVLSQRYAKGEIDREEYMRRREDIKRV